MTTLKIVNGQDQIYNEAGLQLVGAHSPDQEDGLNPRELLEASLALCVSISLQKMMSLDGVQYDKDSIHIEVTSSKDKDRRKNRFAHFNVEITLPPTLPHDYKEKLKTVVERACTISNTLKSEAVVKVIEKQS